MSSLYKVTKIEGKGLGCVAVSDIKKGSLILSEKLQLCVGEREMSSMWIKSLLKSFYQMSKADQHEYMTLHNQYNNIQNLQNSEDIQKIVCSKMEIDKIEQDPEKAEKILEICGIYSSNSFEDGFCVKMSRFNHSCQPNASSINVNDEQQLRAIENIKAGKEINFSYLSIFAGFRNTKYRRQKLLKKWGFFCSCDLCENDVDVDAEAFEAYIQEAEKLFIDRQLALKDGISHGAQYYSLDKCRKEILCCKKLYKVAWKDQTEAQKQNTSRTKASLFGNIHRRGTSVLQGSIWRDPKAQERARERQRHQA